MKINNHLNRILNSRYSWVKTRMKHRILRQVPKGLREDIYKSFFNTNAFLSENKSPFQCDKLVLRKEWEPYKLTILKLIKSLVNEWEYHRICTYREIINGGPSTKDDLKKAEEIHEEYKRGFWKVINWI